MRRIQRKGISRKVLISLILIAAAAAAVTGTLVFFVFQRSGQSPTDVIRDYAKHVQAGEYSEMYEMLSEETKEQVEKETFVNRNKNIYEGVEAADFKIQVLEEEEQGHTARADCRISFSSQAGEISFNKTLELVREEGAYHLKWSDDMILPDLDSTDKVRVQTVKAQRGRILDRNGKVLAENGTASSVGLVPGKMSEDPREDIEKLAELLGVSPESINEKLSAGWVKEDSFVPVRNIEKVSQAGESTDGETSRGRELQEQLLAIDGVLITDTSARTYPYKEAAAHLTGYVQNVTAEDLEEHAGEGYGSDSVIGKSGMEALYEKELKGEDGCTILIQDDAGNTKETIASKSKKDGDDITLTIDMDLQQKLYQEYKEDKSCSVAMNPKTGEVLALVSTPSYDPEDFVLGMSQEQWSALSENEDNPMQNRFRAAWCPGSSFKPVIAGIGVTSGRLDPDQDLGAEGLSWKKDESWGTYSVTTLHAASPAVMKNALVYSDNIYFAKAALQIGEDTLKKEFPRLGFGEEVPFPIIMTKSRFSNSDGFDSEIQLADTGYGQGQVLVNPLHLADIYSAFVNNGNMIEPKLLTSQGKEASWWKEGVFSRDAADRINDALTDVIEDPNGTGHGCYIEGLNLAGKTGTAEIKASKEDTSGTELGWMAVYTTDRDKEDSLLLVTMTEDVKGRGGSGYVAGHTRNVLESYLQ